MDLLRPIEGDSQAAGPVARCLVVGHCADLGRDVSEITCSVNVRIDPDAPLDNAIAEAKAYENAGVDLVIMNLPLDASPSVLEPLAKALA